MFRLMAGCLRCAAPYPNWVRAVGSKNSLEQPQAEEYCGICYVEGLAQAPCVRYACATQ
jgi:hypothetical protein